MQAAGMVKAALSHSFPSCFCPTLIKKSMVPSIYLLSRLRPSTRHHASFCWHVYVMKRVTKLNVIFKNLFTFENKIVKAMRHCSFSGF